MNTATFDDVGYAVNVDHWVGPRLVVMKGHSGWRTRFVVRKRRKDTYIVVAVRPMDTLGYPWNFLG
jgi:hypothetical protein